WQLGMRILGKLRSSAPEPACSNVLTPARIPAFCIPPRLSWNYPPESSPLDMDAGHTDWDPRSQAALSLPHLPRTRTAYGFCALLESPHTRRKESLFLGDPGATALLCSSTAGPRAHTYGDGSDGGRGGSGPLASPPAPGATLASPRPSPEVIVPVSRSRRLLRAPDRLLSRALRSRRSRGLARARSVSSGDDEDERSASPEPAVPVPACRSPAPGRWRERLQAEATVTLGRAGGSLRLVAEYNRASGRLRLRLLRVEGPAGGALEPRAVGCRLSLVLQPPGPVRMRSAGIGCSHKAALDQDFCFDGLSDELVRRLAVRIKAELRSQGLERGCLLGQGELLLGSLLFL
uniref:C2 calcium-dependent domain-containing protein 4A n=1 Tax=Castor canadensis TaxID=51338 RepID=A0A8C0X9Q7_CASCN